MHKDTYKNTYSNSISVRYRAIGLLVVYGQPYIPVQERQVAGKDNLVLKEEAKGFCYVNSLPKMDTQKLK